jgi:coenzyme F420 hydrogenase subunit beta
MMTGHATDPAIRHTGASGGGLSAILISLLDGDTVDAVVQVAADPDRPIGNATVLSLAQDDVIKAAGSRYAPSAPLADLEMRLAEHEATGRRFAFVGKPCDAAALSAMRGQDPQIASAFPVILSFFCAGVPSFTGVRALLTALGTDETQTAHFRYRGNGWPGQASAVNHDGQNRSMSYHESWGNILSRHVQHRCKICADGTGVAADIVCADAWESDAAGYPVFTEGDGTSLIVARTPLGADLVNAARAEGRIETKPFDVTALAAIQPGQRNRRRALLARLAALKLAGHPIPRYRGLRLIAAARQNTMKSNLKNFAGMLQRVILSKIKPAHH